MKVWVTIFCCSLSTVLYAQDSTTEEDINKDIWYNYMQAYQDLDASLFHTIHSDQFFLIDSTAHRFVSQDGLLETFNSWNREGMEQRISFSFLGREQSEDWAFETIIYKLTRYGKGQPQVSYGRFSVLLRKAHGRWRIFEEGGMIDFPASETDFLSGARLAP